MYIHIISTKNIILNDISSENTYLFYRTTLMIVCSPTTPQKFLKTYDSHNLSQFSCKPHFTYILVYITL